MKEVVKSNGASPSAPDATPAHQDLHPLASMRRLINEMERTVGDWGFTKGWLTPLFGRDPLAKRIEEFGKDLFLPDIEVVEKEGTMTVRADLPGIKKDDVSIELTNNSLVIRGERRREEKEEREGYYRSERSYGSFYRNIPFRDGVEADDARAVFNDGVLEVTLKTRKNGRRVEIR
jgi:HSP20 family protein